METKTTNELTQTQTKQAVPSPEDRVRARQETIEKARDLYNKLAKDYEDDLMPDECFEFAADFALSLVEELKGQVAAQEKEINRLTGMWAERADESEGWQSKFNAAEAEAEKAKARLVRVEAIIDDPDRKVEYGTPEYFLLQRIRAALTPEPATKAEVSHER
jgi:hypothetical protein